MMKKVVYGISFLVLSLLFATDVYASSVDISIMGDSTFEEEITLNVQVGDMEELDGICGLVGNLDYDSSKLELTSIEGMDDFDLTYGTKAQKIVLYQAVCVNSGTNILTMKFKNLSLSEGDSTTISIKNMIATDGDNEINVSEDISKSIKLVNDDSKEDTDNKQDTNTNTENNSNNNSNTLGDDKENEEELNKDSNDESKSSNNYLSSISLSKGNLKFSKDVLTYDVIVGYDTDVIDIKANAEDKGAKITGVGKHNLKVGRNVIDITIEAEDGTERTYTINVNREEKGIVVEDDNNDIADDNGNIVMYSIIGILVLIAIIAIVYFVKKNMNKNK